MRDVLLLITGACLLTAATFRPPKLGYIYDPDAAAIRVISGVSGAAALEETVATGSKLAFAAVAPGARYALVRLRDEAGYSVLQFATGALTPIEGATGSTDVVAFSAASGSAAVWTGDRILVWTGLPDSPAFAREIGAGEVSALAVAEDGGAVAARTPAGTLVWESGESPRAIEPATAMTFVPGSHDLLVAGESGNRLSVIRAGETEVLATEKDGVSGVVALAVTADGGTVAAAGEHGRLAALNMTTREISAAECDCTPAELLAMGGDRLFVLRASNGDVRLLDAARGDLSLFVLSVGGGR